MSNSFPKILHCVVCEDARVEQGGLLTLTGVYGIVPDFAILVTDFKNHIPRLTFVFTSGPGEGSYSIGLDIVDMNGKSVFQFPTQDLIMPLKKSSDRFNQLIMGIGNIVFPGPGKYELRLNVDGSIHYRGILDLRENQLQTSATSAS